MRSKAFKHICVDTGMDTKKCECSIFSFDTEISAAFVQKDETVLQQQMFCMIPVGEKSME